MDATITPMLHDVDGRRRREAGHPYGETDEFCYNVARDPVQCMT